MLSNGGAQITKHFLNLKRVEIYVAKLNTIIAFLAYSTLALFIVICTIMRFAKSITLALNALRLPRHGSLIT